MSLAAIPKSWPIPSPLGITLLELVTRISQLAETEADTVELVYALLESGRVRLTGNFRGLRLERPH
jgi:hypothetical protein